MPGKRLILDHLRDLCDRYVPLASRHEGSLLPLPPISGDEWWWAHEIGHLLTVPLENIGRRYFGLGSPDRRVRAPEHELRCRELAAMSVSRRLLHAAGRRDLARRERANTCRITLYWEDRGRVQQILAERQCLQLPRDRDRLERKLQGVRAQARHRKGKT